MRCYETDIDSGIMHASYRSRDKERIVHRHGSMIPGENISDYKHIILIQISRILVLCSYMFTINYVIWITRIKADISVIYILL